ncbi:MULTISPECIES: metal-dependent transcriptional regulator [Paenarthrobacter]|uniref:Manganese transport regulator n=1 Tax=Paenarthrobacter ureafaciens TaxID=37931 RepID=A0AAX3EQG5_PAEUR|nr:MULTISPECIES: metal-dependent transcriptional regulator [Paenarthrobacter]MDO5878134.1 metal-dependent transcriptional regulator [Paenarthrobacter sp. SD-1]NHW49289.1 metal-dependent transcriptional regulator [Paenarthrobacter sp. MSM-2-10-13]UYW00004.1 metal-dependent transcriptional regulator [Paenarthrobacter ureafaciens]
MGTSNTASRTVSTPKAADLTAVAQDYLKSVWSAQEWSDEPVTVGLIAERLGVSASTASEGIRKYTAQGLLRHARYGGVELTPVGTEYALMMVRRHRLLETFLVEKLGYRWDEVHHEAEVLEHAVSDTFITRIDALLGQPRHDPHGDPIPSSGEYPDTENMMQLNTVPTGLTVVIRRVSDDSSEMLRYFAHHGLIPGTGLSVQEPKAFTAGIPVHVADTGKDVVLGNEAAAALWVEITTPGSDAFS